MDFARRQLEKYGWSDGKGLGKNENGISEALKPKLKRSVTGIGHDAAAEFNEHWWSTLYDKAAKNIEVKEKNGKTRKIETVDGEEFTITNSTWRINKKRKNASNDNEYKEYFVRKEILTNEGTKVENVTDSESEDEGGKKKDVFKLTDEELFAACEGRTAHKGARHGLKALGKLARIAQQEQILLTQSKYQEYSHAKKCKNINKEIMEDISLEDDQDKSSKNKKKKKKRKRCFSHENSDANIIGELAESDSVLQDSSENVKSEARGDAIVKKEKGNGSKQKRRVCKDEFSNTECDEYVSKSKKKKKGLSKLFENEANEISDMQIVEESTTVSKKKKRKKQCRERIIP